jgi:hypothetical protein
MRHAFFLITMLALGALAQAQSPIPRANPTASASPAAKRVGKLAHVFLSTSADGTTPSIQFKSDVPKICAIWKGDALRMNDRLRGVWLAEDIGTDSRRDRLIIDAQARAYKRDDDGVFSLGRPREGWPIGKYRFELYVNNHLSDSVTFTIEPGVAIEVH